MARAGNGRSLASRAIEAGLKRSKSWNGPWTRLVSDAREALDQMRKSKNWNALFGACAKRPRADVSKRMRPR